MTKALLQSCADIDPEMTRLNFRGLRVIAFILFTSMTTGLLQFRDILLQQARDTEQNIQEMNSKAEEKELEAEKKQPPNKKRKTSTPPRNVIATERNNAL